jgi:hypothetical protein
MSNQELRAEAEILNERISVLRAQETRYNDLSKEIAAKKEEMIKIEEEKARLTMEATVYN